MAIGNLALSRFHSKHVALRMWFLYRNSLILAVCLYIIFDFVEIKAMEEGIFGERYSAI